MATPKDKIAAAKPKPIDKALNTLERFATTEQVEKLRLLASSVVGVIGDPSKRTFEIYKAILGKNIEEPNAVVIMVRLLRSAGYPVRYIEELSKCVSHSQPSVEMPTLYFYEMLVNAADQLGDGKWLRYLKNIIPIELLNQNLDEIKTSVRLFQLLVFSETLSSRQPATSLEILEGWFIEIGRRDIAVVMRDKINELGPDREDNEATNAPPNDPPPPGDEDNPVVAMETVVAKQEQTKH